MKTRREIEELWSKHVNQSGDLAIRNCLDIQTTLLLDIRDLLQTPSKEEVVSSASLLQLEDDYGTYEPMKPERDALFDKAVAVLKRKGKGTSVNAMYVAKALKITMGRASAIIDQLEEAGIISAREAGKPRRVL